ncbi:methyltransferase domain-containing protein [Micromonospora sp. WMMD1082]|uniref:class I SAM-dependent methyltransferase n=1 Tax=Micromonospora sp. WMMD1082 TaxID=3016104 RepID=UPI0024162109|nr:methyltransferase domain-containing protein [Micromonospora sp. WMMD1082]MDG4795178.1 methyltransferase domain-containing protein [Micromonospora sp. WMMD1082]
MTATTLPAPPGPLHRVLDRGIENYLDRMSDIKTNHKVLEIGAGIGSVTARLAAQVGRYGAVTAVDRDVSHLTPTSVVDVHRRDLDRELLPGTAGGFDVVVARWPHGALRDPADVLEQMIVRLRLDGWLVLADVVASTPPRVYLAPDEESGNLIHTVLRQVHGIITGRDGGTWTADADALLLDNGLTQQCVHTTAETWTGGGDGCRLLADIVTYLRPALAGVTDADATRFTALMADHRVLLRPWATRLIHARKVSGDPGH